MDDAEKALQRAEDMCKQSKIAYSHYLQTGIDTDELLESTICLAQIDPIFRAGVVDPNIGVVNKRDVEDLRNLLSAIDPRMFKAENVCVLNPTFDEDSQLVSGADCDTYIDNKLIDIKTTKFLKFEKSHFNQLIGYYILFTIGGVDHAFSTDIKDSGLYFARHAVLQTIPVTTFTQNPKFNKFTICISKFSFKQM